MTKKSKILEKGSRLPDLREARLDRTVSEYLSAVRELKSESARSQRFTLLLNDLFGVQPGFIEEYVAGVEKYLKAREKDALVRGRTDELFGNVIIEFERDLTERGKLAEAEGQLQKYVACLWSQEPASARTRYLCLATDGVRFQVYTPVLSGIGDLSISPGEVGLRAVDQIDAGRTGPPRELYYWLDRYLVRREILAPRSENIVKDFGLRSHAFQVAAQELLAGWNRLKVKPQFGVVYEAWERYLRIVYGSALADDELFVRHTYLAALAKMMAWSRLSEGNSVPGDDEILAVLEGQFFKDRGIENFLEEDFFSWPARGEAREVGVEVSRLLLGPLRNYNLRELSEDVLKSLYQELIDPKTRHDLGEYYTPDWLAARMVRRLLAGSPVATILDPSCGSGTFLYQAIREKRKLLGDSAKTLEHIQDAVIGVDIHPLAVIVAKTNYVLALGDLIRVRRGKIVVPIYLSNAIHLPERVTQNNLWMQIPSHKIELEGQAVYLPDRLLDQPTLYDQAIESAREFALQWTGKKTDKKDFENYLKAQHPQLVSEEKLVSALFAIAEMFRGFIEVDRDTIWAFVLKNAYKPLFLKGRFDVVMGNPPWLSYRYVEQTDYQGFLKEQITRTYRLLSGKGELITQMELGTLFLLRTADLYLKGGGKIAFVLPRSIFSADQHDALRRYAFQGPHLTWSELWDLEGVRPLFNVPACVLFGEKGSQPSQGERREKSDIPVPGQALTGQLLHRNASLLEAEGSLRVENLEFFLNLRGKRSYWSAIAGAYGPLSYYKRRFFQGATIVPRPFWFVEVQPSPIGFDPGAPPLVTSRRAQEQAKDAYRGIVFTGRVESRFLYATLLSTDLLPFAHLDYRLVVLPVEPAGQAYRLMSADQARQRGFIHLAEWLEKAQYQWAKRRGKKAELMDIYQRLDRVHGLTRQDPRPTHRVLYIKSGTHLCACVTRNGPVKFEVGGQFVHANGFIADHVTYSSEVGNEKEAHYLAAILNSPVVDKLIKPMQSRGQWGPRDIHKKVFDLPVPQFDPRKAAHRRLSGLSEACSERVRKWLLAGGPGDTRSIGRLRSMVRDILRLELAEIDGLVQDLLRER